QGIADAVAKLTADQTRAVEVTGAIVNDGVVSRIEAARSLGEVVLDSHPVTHPAFPDAEVRTPLLLVVDGDSAALEGEWFGPIAFLVATPSTVDSVALFQRTVGAKGGLTAGVYSTSPEVLADVERAALDVGVHLSANLTGAVFVNQSAAFSDFH